MLRKEVNVMTEEFINITPENLADEHLCCIIRTKKPHPGIAAKKRWLAERIKEGHVFRKLNVKGTVFIEYAPLETAWVPVVGKNYYYLYCLWITGEYRQKGYGRALLEYCIDDARRNGKSGICMLGAAKQKSWLSDQSFAKKFGFRTVDQAAGGYELLALSFDGSVPTFTDKARRGEIDAKELTIYHDYQCPYIFQRIEAIRKYTFDNGIEASFIEIDSLQKAKAVPSAFNNWAVFYGGKLITVNLLDVNSITKILGKQR